mmetsp:Transcript_40201/g.29648  ORF Transcript_40201/g.29648 Transcript_40201/m.29648 type:complete len:149 (+) Transcript_40201:990-1436(+)
MLRGTGGLECFMVKAPARFTQKSKWMLVFYVAASAIALIFFVLVAFPRQGNGANGLTAILALSTFIMYAAVTIRDPGYIYNKKVPFIELLEHYKAEQLCPDCQVIRTVRSRHCSVCHRCVERFDHHCPWINNCIGVRNHNHFIIYVVL